MARWDQAEPFRHANFPVYLCETRSSAVCLKVSASERLPRYKLYIYMRRRPLTFARVDHTDAQHRRAGLRPA